LLSPEDPLNLPPPANTSNKRLEEISRPMQPIVRAQLGWTATRMAGPDLGTGTARSAEVGHALRDPRMHWGPV
jgi:hypothetical protein